jgi:opacity protein-like surface antigen
MLCQKDKPVGRALIVGMVALVVPVQGLADMPHAPRAGGAVFLQAGDPEAYGLRADAEFDLVYPFDGLDGSGSEPEIAYRRSDTDKMRVLGVTLTGDLSVDRLSRLANDAFGVTFGPVMRPYLSVGIGATSGISESDTVFAAGAGIGFHVAEKVILFSGYRLFGTTDPKLEGRAGCQSHSLVAGVRVLF